MIGQILPRGSGVRGLLYYLFTDGLAGEKGMESDHLDARIVACWDGHLQDLQPPVGPTGHRDFTELAGRLDEPVAALGYSKQELRTIKPVYHLAIAAAKDRGTGAPVDRTLTDAQWADIAQEYMHRIGLARRRPSSGCRPCAALRPTSFRTWTWVKSPAEVLTSPAMTFPPWMLNTSTSPRSPSWKLTSTPGSRCESCWRLVSSATAVSGGSSL